jgi:hypothetical protein
MPSTDSSLHASGHRERREAQQYRSAEVNAIENLLDEAIDSVPRRRAPYACHLQVAALLLLGWQRGSRAWSLQTQFVWRCISIKLKPPVSILFRNNYGSSVAAQPRRLYLDEPICGDNIADWSVELAIWSSRSAYCAARLLGQN